MNTPTEQDKAAAREILEYLFKSLDGREIQPIAKIIAKHNSKAVRLLREMTACAEKYEYASNYQSVVDRAKAYLATLEGGE